MFETKCKSLRLQLKMKEAFLICLIHIGIDLYNSFVLHISLQSSTKYNASIQCACPMTDQCLLMSSMPKKDLYEGRRMMLPRVIETGKFIPPRICGFIRDSLCLRIPYPNIDTMIFVLSIDGSVRTYACVNNVRTVRVPHYSRKRF
jgi:hypothetical protein